ncbi:MAG: EFR1 family ferrodoxin [Endomicrobium sp.]|nr:EFR1 family ferrodoxin [Endomicrobium sp.]
MKIKTVDIFFFTGTGNTLLAAKKIADALESNNCVVAINDMAKTNPQKINLSNTIGIGFPVACWNTFPIVKKFIDNLPQANGAEIFTFTTMGDSSLNAAANFGDILKNKGYTLIGTRGFLMPNNFIAVQKEEKNILKRERAYFEMEKYAKDLADGTTKAGKTNLFFKICFAVSGFITDRWNGNLFQKIVKFRVVNHRCSKCGLCVKICPVQNISIKNGCPVFNGKKCQVCMRCISYCPQRAIKSFLINKTYRALNDEEIKKWFF